MTRFDPWPVWPTTRLTRSDPLILLRLHPIFFLFFPVKCWYKSESKHYLLILIIRCEREEQKGKDLEANIYWCYQYLEDIEQCGEKLKESLSKIRIDRYNSVHTNLGICDLFPNDFEVAAKLILLGLIAVLKLILNQPGGLGSLLGLNW